MTAREQANELVETRAFKRLARRHGTGYLWWRKPAEIDTDMVAKIIERQRRVACPQSIADQGPEAIAQDFVAQCEASGFTGELQQSYAIPIGIITALLQLVVWWITRKKG